MTVLIVGSGSMLGKRLQRRLGPAFTVMTAGRSNTADVRFDLAASFTPPTDAGTFDVVIHCAGSFGGNSLEESVHNETVNAVGSLRVAALAQAVRCRHLISMNSISIYDHPDNQYFGSYALSKKHGHENLLRTCNQLGIGYTALLVSQIYDEYGEARRHQPALYQIVDCARSGSEVVLFGCASPRRNFIFIEDVAVVVQRVIEQELLGTYPVLASESPTFVEVAETAFRVFGSAPRIRRLIDKPDPLTIYLPDDRRIYDCLGWHATTTLQTGLTLIRDHVRPPG
jgi:nucleoside-diphosphate-sugar epimerase